MEGVERNRIYGYELQLTKSNIVMSGFLILQILKDHRYGASSDSEE